MRKSILLPFASLLIGSPALAAFPVHVFSPWVQVDSGRNLQNSLATLKTSLAQPYFTLGFVISDGSGNGTWGGTGNTIASGAYLSSINSLRSGGGDVIFSFGGAGGNELAVNANNNTAAILQTKYEAVISKYNATWFDFDIEGTPLSNTAANQRRNTALAALQAAHPGLQVSFTLPGDPNGLDSNSIALLQDAKNKGVAIRTVNVMTMDFGSSFSSGKTMAQVCQSTLNAVKSDLAAVDANIKIGLTPMIGQNDVSTEMFTTTDATSMLNFANANSWINFIGMWSLDRDRYTGVTNPASDTSSGFNAPDNAFTGIFNDFNSPVPEPAALGLLGTGALLLLNRRNRAKAR